MKLSILILCLLFALPVAAQTRTAEGDTILVTLPTIPGMAATGTMTIDKLVFNPPQTGLPPACDPFDWFMRSKDKKLFLCESKNSWTEVPTAMTAIDIAHGGTGKATKKDAFDALSPLAGKGSLLVFDGKGNVSLPLCGNEQTLIADSTALLGWKCGAFLPPTLKPIQFTMTIDPATGKVSILP